MTPVPAIGTARSLLALRLPETIYGGGILIMSFFSGIVDENDRIWPQGCSPSFRAMLGLLVEEYLSYAQGEVNAFQNRCWSAFRLPPVKRHHPPASG